MQSKASTGGDGETRRSCIIALSALALLAVLGIAWSCFPGRPQPDRPTADELQRGQYNCIAGADGLCTAVKK